MENIILLLILGAIAGGIIWYLIRCKKRGDACVGCPHGKNCCHKGKCPSHQN